jgi:broad specificity phosphatase PhoE
MTSNMNKDSSIGSGSTTQSASPNTTSNHLAELSQLHNQFVALRHGQSLANVAGIIAADPSVACHQYGLSEVGRVQARQAGLDAVHLYRSGAHDGVAILASDLLRAQETATIMWEAFVQAQSRQEQEATAADSIPVYTNAVVTETRLRERGFGSWDGTSDAHYALVWNDDALDSSHTIQGVESVDSTMDRTTRCIVEWDQRLRNHLIFCVAHGDVLQILQTAFSKMDGRLHRSLEHLETAQVRLLQLSP